MGDKRFELENGAQIAVIGGGPTGTFFSTFALKMAKMVGKDINLTIYDPKNFTKDGPGGCNKCGGVISELLVQSLAIEGIILPHTVVHRGINSYVLHTENGDVTIQTPSNEQTIASVYRGGGPKGVMGKEMESFDNFLLGQAIQEGAVHRPVKVDKIEYSDGRPVLYSGEERLQEADLVVGAFGVNGSAYKVFEDMGFGYKKPEIVTAAIAEVSMKKPMILKYFGNSIHLFLLPIKDIKFAAMIPKSNYVTVCVLGKEMTGDTVQNIIDHPVVQRMFPDKGDYEVACRCLPKMNVQAPQVPFADRIVICGDAGSTRLFKDGLGAAYLMGKAAAKTAVLEGVGKEDFREHYYPVYKSIINDNMYGRFLFFVTDLYKKYSLLCKTMVAVVNKEQGDPDYPKRLSAILWDMFTGNERYKKIFKRSLSMGMQKDLASELAKTVGGGGR